jgi:PAS domain S-box-containing protein
VDGFCLDEYIYLYCKYLNLNKLSRSEMALKKSLFDLSKDHLIIVNHKGMVKEFNPSFLQYSSLSTEVLKGKKLLNFVHPDDILPAKMFLSDADFDKGFTEQTLRLQKGDGKYTPVNLVLKSKTERETLLQVIDLEVFQQRESDKFINEHVLFLILDLVPFPIFVKNYRSEYILLNQAQANLFGMSIDEMLGKTDSDLIKDEEELETVKESDKKVLESLQKLTLAEQQFSTPNGHRYVLQTIKVPFINAVSGERNILGVSIDYTERKFAEEELMRTNFELDSFVYRSSHDLKAPLKSILGLVSLMRLDKSADNIAECVDKMETAILRLDRFISDLTNYSRNARLDLQKHPVNLQELVVSTMDHLKYLDPTRKVSLDIQIEAPTDFYSDKHRIEVVLQNILSNAIKYQKPDSSKPKISIRGKISDEFLLLIIKDNGIGIKKEYQHGIFNMFYRATERSEGSGLGLYIAKQSVEKLQGTISFESAENKGTTFTINLRNLR